MKKIVSILLTVLMIVSLLSVASSALTPSDWEGLKFTTIRQVMNGYDLALDDILDYGKYCMRGFAVTPDGKTMFGGFLNPSGTSAIVMWDNTTGKPTGYYQYTPNGNTNASYPKGLAADDRGYLYAGLAANPNYYFADFAIIKYAEKDYPSEFMKTVSVTRVIETTEKTKIGVNGVTVENILGTYYCYVVINYDVDYLYRFDVTDPAAPKLDTAFGTDGRVNLQEVEVGGAKITEGNYIDVDSEGFIYMGFTSASGAGIVKLSNDGKSVLASAQQTKGYGVCALDEVVLCSTQSAPSEIVVYNKADLSKVTSFTITTANSSLPYADAATTDFMSLSEVNSICNIGFGGGCLFFADQGTNALPDQVFCVSVDNGDALLSTIKSAVDALANPAEETTAEVTTAEETTAEVTTADITTAEVTTAAAEITTAGAEVTTAAPAAKSGCGSVCAAGVVIVSIIGSALIVRKKH